MLAALARSLLAPRRSAFGPLSFTRYSSSTPAPEAPTEGEKTIIEKLNKRFSPSQLRVQDVSGGCGSFYAIVIASEAFKGLSTVKQHKLVTETLKSEIKGIHGLQIKTIRE